jgi:hypothetical protein
MEEEKDNVKKLDKRYIVGINNIILSQNAIDEIWHKDDDTL